MTTKLIVFAWILLFGPLALASDRRDSDHNRGGSENTESNDRDTHNHGGGRNDNNGYHQGNGYGYGHCKNKGRGHHSRPSRTSPGHTKFNHECEDDDEKLILISGLADINLGRWQGPGSGDLTGFSQFCVGITELEEYETSEYQLSVSGAGGASGFSLSNGWDSIDYSVFISDSSTIVGNSTEPNQVVAPLRVMTGENEDLNTRGCNKYNARISIKVSERDILSASPGQYTDNLTITVAPI